ncbi:MAG: AsmA family protein [Candidatus Nitrotoga sp.]
MNKYIKYTLILVGAVFVITAAALTYIAATFNPNDYKSKIIQLVQEKKQRTLKLDGDIKLTLFPNIGANIDRVLISEFQSKQDFATVENVQVSLALLPLFARQVVVNQVAINGLNAKLIKYKNGKTNIDDLLSGDEKKDEATKTETVKSESESPPVKFDIAAVSLHNLSFSYLDEKSAAQYKVNKLNLKTGRIAFGVPIKLELDALIKANKPKLNLTIKVQGNLLLNPEIEQYGMQNANVQVNGNALDISNLTLQGKGDFNQLKQDLTVDKLLLTFAGTQAKNSLSANLDAPKLRLNSGQLSSEKFILDLEMAQPLQKFQVKLTAVANGNLEKKIINLADLTLKVSGAGDALPNKAVSGEMPHKGTMKGSIHMQGDSLQIKLAGGMLQSQVKIQVAVNNFAQPAIKFDIEADQFDVDAYLPKAEPTAPTTKAASLDEPLDLSALRSLNLDGRLRVGAFKVANLKIAQMDMGVKAKQGIVDVSPLAANLYQGSVHGSLRINAQATPAITIKQKLSDINIAPLLKDMADFDTLMGRGDVTLDLKTQGNTVNALKKSLNGNMALLLKDGAIKGINIAKKIRDVQGKFGKGSAAQTESANKEEQTDFSEMKASFKVTQSVAHNDDLLMKSPLLRLSGVGDIDIGNDSINYLARATLAKTLEGQGGSDQVGGLTVPVRLSGPFTNLKYKLEFESMVSEATKQKIEAKKEEIKAEIKTEIQNKLKSKLKGLFK